jgi:hypothetical protein
MLSFPKFRITATHLTFAAFALGDTVGAGVFEDVWCYFHALTKHLICNVTDLPLSTVAATMLEEVEE